MVPGVDDDSCLASGRLERLLAFEQLIAQVGMEALAMSDVKGWGY